MFEVLTTTFKTGWGYFSKGLAINYICMQTTLLRVDIAFLRITIEKVGVTHYTAVLQS